MSALLLVTRNSIKPRFEFWLLRWHTGAKGWLNPSAKTQNFRAYSTFMLELLAQILSYILLPFHIALVMLASVWDFFLGNQVSEVPYFGKSVEAES